jgi:hypothetical protein
VRELQVSKEINKKSFFFAHNEGKQEVEVWLHLFLTTSLNILVARLQNFRLSFSKLTPALIEKDFGRAPESVRSLQRREKYLGIKK